MLEEIAESRKRFLRVNPKWKDKTSYSQGQEKKIPEAFVLKLPNLTISLIWSHIHNPDRWFLNCETLGLYHIDLGQVIAEEAERLAKEKIHQRFDKIRCSLEEWK